MKNRDSLIDFYTTILTLGYFLFACWISFDTRQIREPNWMFLGSAVIIAISGCVFTRSGLKEIISKLINKKVSNDKVQNERRV